MPSPKKTDNYPLWLKQGLHALLDNADDLPYHLHFSNEAELQQFRNLFYGYQKALRIEEAERASPSLSPYSQELSQLMLRKALPYERQFGEGIEYVICLRDDNPHTANIAKQFQPLIEKSEEKALSTPPTLSTRDMEDAIDALGYSLPSSPSSSDDLADD